MNPDIVTHGRKPKPMVRLVRNPRPVTRFELGQVISYEEFERRCVATVTPPPATTVISTSEVR